MVYALCYIDYWLVMLAIIIISSDLLFHGVGIRFAFYDSFVSFRRFSLFLGLRAPA